ncbi:MAG: DUF1874 domain-containing protein [Methanobrevibacter sp.]|nr:DUF1874 domain-containing protein [Methanobrevibacter sp.]
MMNYIGNSFSPKMLTGKKNKVSFKRISEDTFRKHLLGSKSIIGHEQLADMIGVEANRESIHLQHGDTLYCVLAKPERLPEKHSIIIDRNSFYYMQCKV